MIFSALTRRLFHRGRPQGQPIRDVIASSLRKKSTAQVMREAAALLDGFGGQVAEGMACALRERIALVGESAPPRGGHEFYNGQCINCLAPADTLDGCDAGRP